MKRLLACALAVWLVSGSAIAARAAESDRYKGLTLSAALGRLQQQGLRIVFSSDLVRPDMVVPQEPRGRWPREILDDLLARHGLRSRPGPAGTLLVVKAALPAKPAALTRNSRRSSSVTPSHSETVVVSGRDAASQKGRPDARESVAGRRLETAPDHGNDPLASIGRLGGVATNTAAGGLNVRGGAARETKIVLDGLELYEPYHLKDLGGPVSLLDTHAVAGIELLSGAFPAEYGGHMGGVVQMETVEAAGAWTGEAGVASNGARVATQGVVGDRLSWVASARQAHGAGLLNALGADPGFRPSYWDVFAKADLRLDDRTQLSLHLLGGDDEAEGKAPDDFINTVTQAGTFKSRHTNRYGWLTAKRAWSPALFSQLMISRGHFTIDRVGSSPRVAAVHDARSVDIVGIKNDWLLQSRRHFLKAGLDYKHVQASYRYGALQRSPKGADVGVYAADRVRVSPRLSVELGMRWDTQSYVPKSHVVFEPRLNAVYDISDRTAIRMGWGRFSQTQKIHELQIEDGVTEFLPAEVGEQNVASIAHQFTNGIQAQLSAYRQRTTGLHPRYESLFNPISFFKEAEADRVRIAPTAGRADGLELTIRSSAARTAGWWAAYGVARADDRIDETWVPRSWDQRHTLNAGLDWTPARGWVFAAAGHFHTGRPTTPLVAGGFDIRNSRRLDDYSGVDVRLGRSIRLRGAFLDVNIVVTNVLNREGQIGPRLRQGLPRLVTAGAVWKF
jgi:hypothetical protein